MHALPGKTVLRRVLAWTLALLLAACGGGGGGGGLPGGGGPNEQLTGSVAGNVVLVDPAPGIRVEAEPNDTLDQAQDLGDLPIGARFSLLGQLDAAGDPLDGYRLRLPQRARLEGSLGTSSIQAEVLLYDPLTMQVVGTFDGPSSPFAFVVPARGAFDLVVRAVSGAGPYELTLRVERPSARVEEQEPNDAPAEGTWLGTLGDDETFTLHGAGNATTDPSDAWLLAVTEARHLALEFEFPAFDDFALLVHDVTVDVASPVLLATLEATAGNVVTGDLEVAAGRLLALEVVARAGSGFWTVDVTGSPPTGSPKALRAPGRRSVASVAVEAARLGLGAQRAYGRAIGPCRVGEAIVALEGGADDEGATRKLEGAAAKIAQRGAAGAMRVTFDVPEGEDQDGQVRYTLSEIRRLGAIEGVAYAEPNYRRLPKLEPDDPYYAYQWHYRMIHLPQAWEITTGSSDVVVAVLDTGRTNHPDLAGRSIGGYDMVSDVWMARDGDGMDPDPTDPGDLLLGSRSSFHGTHVAGTIGAVTDNGTGVAGVTWQTSILDVRVLGRSGGTDYDISQGILWAAQLPNASGSVAPRKAHVINMSLGGPGYSQTTANACQMARSAGVLVVAAAGNESSSQPSYPAAYPGVLAVSAVDAASNQAPYSNFGSWVDIAAPGGNVYADLDGDGYGDGVCSTIWYDDKTPSYPGYTWYNGTSMASPHVAGVAALCLAADPTLTVDALEQILLETADDLGTPGFDNLYGNGLVNAYRAVRAAAKIGAIPPQLAVAPEILNFGSAATTLDLSVQNLGEGFLVVDAPSVSTTTGAPWLAAALQGGGDATRNVDRVRVTVDRTGLPGGAWAGMVTVSSSGGTSDVEVVMRVQTAVLPPDLDVVVQAVRLDTGEVVQTRTVNPRGSTAFNFAALPVGDYVFLAGTDLDGDGEIGEEGDYRGAWPVDGQPQTVTVIENGQVGHIDFAVSLRPVLTTD